MAAAELHLLGQLSGASGFPLSSLFCKFAIESGSNFRVLQGAVEGQTQCDQPNVGLSPALPLRARCSHRRAPLPRGRRRRWPCGRTRSTCTTRSKGSTDGRGSSLKSGASIALGATSWVRRAHPPAARSPLGCPPPAAAAAAQLRPSCGCVCAPAERCACCRGSRVRRVHAAHDAWAARAALRHLEAMRLHARADLQCASPPRLQSPPRLAAPPRALARQHGRHTPSPTPHRCHTDATPRARALALARARAPRARSRPRPPLAPAPRSRPLPRLAAAPTRPSRASQRSSWGACRPSSTRR